MKQTNKVYAAGMSDRKGTWMWQGLVVAPNAKEAKKMLASKSINGTLKAHVDVELSKMFNLGELLVTTKKRGVYDSTNMNDFK